MLYDHFPDLWEIRCSSKDAFYSFVDPFESILRWTISAYTYIAVNLVDNEPLDITFYRPCYFVVMRPQVAEDLVQKENVTVFNLCKGDNLQ